MADSDQPRNSELAEQILTLREDLERVDKKRRKLKSRIKDLETATSRLSAAPPAPTLPQTTSEPTTQTALPRGDRTVAEAKGRGITGFGRMRKAELLTILT